MKTALTRKCCLFVPIYNVEISEDILNIKLFDDYIVIKNEDLTRRYEQYLFSQDFFARHLIQDITERHPNKPIFNPYSKYVLCMEFEVEDDFEAYDRRVHKTKKQIDNFILALRLVNKGLFQVNTGYYLSNGHSICVEYKASSDFGNIQPHHRTGLGTLVREDVCKLNKEALQKTIDMMNILNNISTNEFIVPISYFNKYYNSLTPYERIIQLAVVLESTILSGRNDELGYRLCLRTIALLGKDVQDLIKLFYDIRSNIVHNGHIGKNQGSKQIFKKLKELAKINNKEDEAELLFYFVKDYVEVLIKEILIKSFTLFAQKQAKDFDDLNKKLDSFIIKQIAKNELEVVND